PPHRLRHDPHTIPTRRSSDLCGSQNIAISRIEGRYNDTLHLPGIKQDRIAVFADICDRAIAQTLPMVADYQLTQHTDNELTLNVDRNSTRLYSSHVSISYAVF